MTAAALFAATAAPALGAKRPRPTDVRPTPLCPRARAERDQVFNDYVDAARAPTPRNARSSTTSWPGIDAPPLNDDDADGVPDYVERVADAADTAIPVRRAARLRADLAPTPAGPTGGPTSTSRVSRPATSGSRPGLRRPGRRVLAVSNALDLSPTQSLGSLVRTVAHELFHLVQFSYFPAASGPDLGRGRSRGGAAMETASSGARRHRSSLQLRRWFDAPERSLTGQSYGLAAPLALPRRALAAAAAGVPGGSARGRAGVGARLRVRVHRPCAVRSRPSALRSLGRAGARGRLEPLKRLGPGRRTSWDGGAARDSLPPPCAGDAFSVTPARGRRRPGDADLTASRATAPASRPASARCGRCATAASSGTRSRRRRGAKRALRVGDVGGRERRRWRMRSHTAQNASRRATSRRPA